VVRTSSGRVVEVGWGRVYNLARLFTTHDIWNQFGRDLRLDLFDLGGAV